MFKKRNISVYSDMKTGLLCKFFFIIGLILLMFYIIQSTVPIVDIGENILGSILAFVILFLGLGLLLFFISCQFSKLAKIAEEIEKEESKEDSTDAL
jgi:hypothetical protein